MAVKRKIWYQRALKSRWKAVLVSERNPFIPRARAGLSRRWHRLGVEIASRMGRYRRWREVEWGRVERLVFICSGNICRSPYAEHVARARGFPAISIGTTARSGSGADPVAIEVAGRIGIDLRAHKSLSFENLMFVASDLLVVMDIGHLEISCEVSRLAGAQVTLLGLWDGHHPVVIADPFGRPVDDFERCFGRIEACLDGMLTEASRKNPALI